jgi:allophanate hydrolase subunit 2
MSVRLARDEIFRIGALRDSVCAYLAIEGGPDISPVLGSASTYVRGAIGGFSRAPVQAGDIVPLKLAGVDVRASTRCLDPSTSRMTSRSALCWAASRLFYGRRRENLFVVQITLCRLTPTAWVTVSKDRLLRAKGYNIVSDGIVAGAIQVQARACRSFSWSTARPQADIQRSQP